jgi:hypothetical protein
MMWDIYTYIYIYIHIYICIGYLYRNILLFADDQVIIQDSEDKLKKSVYILNQLTKDYNLKIYTDKTKIMAFKGKHLVRSKI